MSWLFQPSIQSRAKASAYACVRCSCAFASAACVVMQIPPASESSKKQASLRIVVMEMLLLYQRG